MIRDTVNIWLEQSKKDLITNYNKLGLRASGRWAEGLESQAIPNETGITAIIKGLNYTGSLESGRNPSNSSGGGGVTLRDSILEWIKVKGIKPYDNISQESLAFLIARKIHRDGIRVPNKYNAGGLVSNVITDKSVASLIKEVGESLLSDATIDLTNILKNGN